MEGECHYLTGNLRARKRVDYVKKILDDVGVGGDRLQMYNMSAGEGPKFVEAANEMTDRIKGLGPSPIKKQVNKQHKTIFDEEKPMIIGEGQALTGCSGHDSKMLKDHCGRLQRMCHGLLCWR